MRKWFQFLERERSEDLRDRGEDAALRPWEWALAFAVALALLRGTLWPEGAVLNWWSVMFPGLGDSLNGGWTEALRAEGSGVEVRWWLAELLRGLFR